MFSPDDARRVAAETRARAQEQVTAANAAVEHASANLAKAQAAITRAEMRLEKSEQRAIAQAAKVNVHGRDRYPRSWLRSALNAKN